MRDRVRVLAGVEQTPDRRGVGDAGIGGVSPVATLPVRASSSASALNVTANALNEQIVDAQGNPAIDPATGQARLLVDSKKLGTGAELSEAERMQRERARIGSLTGIVSYDWAADGKHLLVPLDGDIYLADLDGNVRRLTETKETELDATVSERGRFVSFVRDNDLYVINVGSGAQRKVADSAKETVSWGLAEFIAQEEMGRRRGHWWAPNDSRIAVARVDESKVEVAVRASIGADKTMTFEQRYPRAGTDNAIVDLYLMNPDGSGRVKADLGKNPDVYLARVDWLHDSSAVIVQRQSRDQKTLDVLRVDARTGASKLLFSDTSDLWINLSDDLHPLKDGSIIFSSERSGFRHLYRWNDGRIEPLTMRTPPSDRLYWARSLAYWSSLTLLLVPMAIRVSSCIQSWALPSAHWCSASRPCVAGSATEQQPARSIPASPRVS